MKKILKKDEGFTIIEVVLVLAIAGLIFLVVFLALPQLQKSRRDTQRRSDASRIAAALESYAGNSNGNYPTSGTELTNFIGTYVTSQNFNDPSTGVAYGNPTTVSGASTAAVPVGTWTYHTNVACGNNGTTITQTGDRLVAVRMGLEQGIYCVDNN